MSTLRQIGGVLKLFFFTKKIVHTIVWCSFVCHLNIAYYSVPVCFLRGKSSHMEKQSQVPSIWKQGMCEGISSQNFPGLVFVSFFFVEAFFSAPWQGLSWCCKTEWSSGIYFTQFCMLNNDISVAERVSVQSSSVVTKQQM